MKSDLKNFESFEVWQRAHDFVKRIYILSAHFPSDERFGITSQLRRAAISITANIAEGFGRYHSKDKANFYIYSRGSLYECHNFLLLAESFKYLTRNDIREILDSINIIGKQLNGLIRSMNSH